MQTFGAYLVALLAASAELASGLPQRVDPPAVRSRGGQTLSVPVKRSKVSKKHPAVALAKVYAKYGKEMPTRLKTIVRNHRAGVGMASSKRSTTEGSATTSPEEYDTAYLTNIQIGTPAQTLPMDFDTGSSDLWVFSSETAASDVSGQAIYSPGQSSTAFKMDGSSWKISYGDGSSSSGSVYTDLVTIGNLSVSGQAVETATDVSSEFTSDAAMSGLVGLAFSSINTVSPKQQSTFFDNAMPKLSQPLFTADLKHDADGSYNFGYIDSSAYTGELFYVDLFNGSADYSGFWSFQSTGYAVGDGSTTTTTGSGTGSTGTGSTGTGTSSGSGSAATGGFGGGSGGSGGGGDSGFGSDGSGSSGFGSPDGGFGDLEDLLDTLQQGTAEGDSSSSSSSSSSTSVWVGWFNKLARKDDKTQARSAPPTRQHAPVAAGSGTGTSTSTSTSKRAVSLTSTSITGIADTGTTLLMLPDEVVSAYYQQVDGAEDSEQEGGYVFSCDQTLPDFTFAVGEGQITVPGEYINWAPVDTANQTCYGGLQSDADIGISIFGDIALKAAFVVFDGGSKRLGWAAKATS